MPTSTSVALCLLFGIQNFICGVPWFAPSVFAREAGLSTTPVISCTTVFQESDFTLVISPDTQKVAVGESTNYAVEVKAFGGFSQPVSLSSYGMPPDTNLSIVTFDVNPLLPGNKTTMRVTIPDGMLAQTYTIIVTGEAGQKVHQTSVKLEVTPADFLLMAFPSEQQVEPGGANGEVFLSVSGRENFNQPVDVHAVVDQPEPSISVSPSSRTLFPGDSLSFKIATTAATPVGVYTLTFTGKAKEMVHSAHATLVVKIPGPDFMLVADKPSLSVPQGASETFKVQVQPVRDFNQPVTLRAVVVPPDGNITVSFSPTSTVNPGERATVMLRTAESTMPKPYTIILSGTSGQTVRLTKVTLTVTTRDFTLGVMPLFVDVTRGQTTQVKVTINRSDFNGMVTVAPQNADELKVKVKPAMMSTTGDSLNFTLKIKKSAPVGKWLLTFIGRDDAGRIRVVTLILTIR